MRCLPISAFVLCLASLASTPSQAQLRLAVGDMTADSRTPWRVWNVQLARVSLGPLRWAPALAAEPRLALRTGELPRLRPAISLSGGGPASLSVVPRGRAGLLVTLQFDV